MTTPTGGTPTGTDLVTLGIGVDTTQMELFNVEGEKMIGTTIEVAKNLDVLIAKADEEAAAIDKGVSATKAKIAALNAEFEAQQAVIAAQKEALAVQKAAADAGQNLITKLEELNDLYGLTREQVFRVRAAELGVAEAAEPLIASLEELIQKDREWAIEQKRDMELYAQRQAAYAEEAAAVQRQIDIQQKRDIEINAARQKDIVSYTAWWEEQIAIQDAAIAKQEQAAIAFQAFKNRTMMENRAEAMRILTQIETDAAALAEKQAIEEIKWNELSVQTRIAQLERLKAYQANPAISAKTIESSFSSAAIADLPNLEKLTAEYNETVKTTSKVQKEATEATNVFSAALGNNRVRTEGLVIAHEALQGRYTRIGGSLMVLTEYLNSASVGMTGFNLATLGVLASLALLGYGIIRGIEQTKELNAALIRTNDIAGMTKGALDDMAHSAGEVHGNFSQAYEAVAKLASSGKFTGDQIKEVTSAVTDLYHAFGTPLQESIKEFESLAVHGTSVGKNSTMEVTKAVEALDEKYHFLNTSILEEIIALEKEGKQREASAIAIKAYSEESERASKAAVEQAGWIEQAWNGVTKRIREAVQALADIGKKQSYGQQEATLLSQLGRKSDGTIETDTSKMGLIQLDLYKQYLAVEDKLAESNRKAYEEGEKTRKQSEANLALTRIAIEDKTLMKKSTDGLTDATKEWGEQLKAIAEQNPEDPMLKDQQYINERYQAILKAHTQTAGRIKDDGRKQDLLAQLANSDAEYEALKSAVTNNEKLLNEANKQGVVTDKQYYDQLRLDRQALKDGLDREYQEKIGYLESYQSKNKTDAEETKKRIQEVRAAHLQAIQDVDQAQAVSDAQEQTNEQKKYTDTINAIEKEATTTLRSLNQQIDKQKEYNAEIGKTKEEKELAKKAADDELTAQMESDANYLDNLLKTQKFDENATAAYTIRLQLLQQEIEARKELSKLLSLGADKEAQAAIQKAADQAWQQTNKKIADDLTNAIIDGGGKGLKKLIRDFELSFARMILNPIIQPISGAIASMVNPNSTFNTLNSAGGAINAVNAARTAYDTISGGISSSVGTGIQSVGNFFGSSAISDFGAGMAGTGTFASSSAALSAAEAAGAVGPEAAEAASLMTTGMSSAAAAGASFASAISTAVPWIAAAAVAYKVFSNVFDNGPEQHTRLQFISNNTPGNISINERGNEGKTNQSYIDNSGTGAFGTFGVNSSFWFSSAQQPIQDFITNVTKTDDALAKFLTKSEISNVTTAVTGHAFTAHFGAEGSDPNAVDPATGMTQLDLVFRDRLGVIFNSIESGMSNLITGFKGTSQELATEAAAILQFRSALTASSETIFGAKVTLDELAALKTPTESVATALNRVVTDFAATNQVATALGKTTADAFGAVGLASYGARENLIALAGGTTQLTQATSSFAQNYLSEAERLAPVSKALDAAFASLNITAPTTREQFKNLVQGLDLTNTEQAKTFISLMALQDAFAQVHPDITQMAKSISDIASERQNIQDQIDQLTMTSTQLLEKQRNALDSSNRTLFDRLQVETKYKDAQTEAVNQLQKAYDAQNTAMQDSINNLSNFENSLKSFNDSLSLGNLSPLTPEQQYAQARSQYASTLSAAQGGDVTAQGNLTSAAQAFLTASRTVNASDQQYQQDFYSVQKALRDTASTTETQLTTEKASLAALNKQVDGLLNINQSVMTVTAAIKELTAITQINHSGTSTHDVNTSIVESLYSSLLNRAPQQSGLQFWTNALDSGTSLTTIINDFLTSPEYLSLHSHAGGLDYVPYNGYKTELHEGESVLTANEAYNYRNTKSSMRPLVTELQGLRSEVASLKEELRNQTGAIVQSNFQANDMAANKVVAGSKSAAKDVVWSNKVKSGATIV